MPKSPSTLNPLLKSANKQIIAMGMLFLMLVKAWVIPVIYLDYELRKEYLIANMCVNRDNPIVVCGAKCYLAKKVAETKKQEERQSEQNSLANLLYQVMDTRKPFSLQIREPFEIPLNITYNYAPVFAALLSADEIFHPPLV